MEVNPPYAALLVPLNIVSLRSNPGYLRWTCTSHSTSITRQEEASII